VHPQFYEASIACLVASLLAVYVSTRSEGSRVHHLVLGLALAMMIWTGSVAVSRFSDSFVLSSTANVVAFVGIFCIPPLWFVLAVELMGPRRSASSDVWSGLVAVPSLAALMALGTNETHHLFIRDTSSLVDGSAAQWAGPLYWVWTVWAFALVLAGVGLYLWRALRLVSGSERRRGVLLAATAFIPLAASLTYNLGLDAAGYDRTPLMMGVAAGLLFLSDWRYRLLPTVPLARRDVIEHLADGVLITDASARILDINPAAEAMIGAELVDVRGRHLVDVVMRQAVDRAAVNEAAFRKVVSNLLESGGSFSKRIENSEGRVFEIRIAAVHPEGGDATGLFLILREITEHSRLDALMRQSQRLETVAGLAAGIAHEVNNPLAYVRSNLSHVHRMLAGFALAESHKDELEELRLVLEEGIQGVDRIGRIIDRVRRFSRIGSEELEPACVNDIVRDALRVARLGRFGSVELGLSLANDLPQIEASGEALTQAVTNLILNAAQAVAQPGGSVGVATRAVGDQVEIRVTDDGPGVPPDVRERIFDPFFTTKKTGEGTGLGLAVSFGIVREHGGVLVLDSPEHGGAEFLIRLPAAGPA